nr:MAG TPA: hypothetical protein [Caudoviricetes sp.]
MPCRRQPEHFICHTQGNPSTLYALLRANEQFNALLRAIKKTDTCDDLYRRLCLSQLLNLGIIKAQQLMLRSYHILIKCFVSIREYICL